MVWINAVILLSSLCQVIGRNWVNVALKKSAYQSSIDVVPNSLPSYNGTAGFAVDGNKDVLNSCMTTSREFDPWWMIDLGELYIISSLQITTLNSSSQKFSNFTIEMSQYVKGNVSQGAMIKPVLCLYHLKAQRKATTKTYYCDYPVMGRYLRITRNDNGNPQPLYFCEIEVYGTSSQRFFWGTSRQGIRSQNDVVGTYTVSSIAGCWARCLQSQSCTSFNIEHIRNRERLCELVADQYDGAPVFGTGTADEGWTHYIIDY